MIRADFIDAVRRARTGVIAGLCLGAGLAACATSSGSSGAGSIAQTRSARCRDVSFPLYFDAGSDQLTAPARSALGAELAGVRGCPVAHVEVVGLADAFGTPEANADLSRRRALAVASVLSEAGLPAPEVRSAGDQGAVRHGRIAPMRRAAEVRLHMAG